MGGYYSVIRIQLPTFKASKNRGATQSLRKECSHSQGCRPSEAKPQIRTTSESPPLVFNPPTPPEYRIFPLRDILYYIGGVFGSGQRMGLIVGGGD